MLKELGYEGVGHIWLDSVAERLKTLDDAGLKLYQITMTVDLTPDKPAYDPRFKDVLALVKGRHVQFDLLIGGMKPSDPAGDDRGGGSASRDVRPGPRLRVAIAPLPARGQLDRADRGRGPRRGEGGSSERRRDVQSLPLAAGGPVARLRPLLERAMPRLWAVSINGADEYDDKPGWDHYIQPLDRGSFDVAGLLRTLDELGYKGPVGLQCFGIGGDARDHLARSMAAWRKIRQTL